jgi:hypothetical protein
MKNLVLTFLLALLVVAAAISVRRVVAGNATTAGQRPALLAIGSGPVPPWPPPVAIGSGPVPPWPPLAK